MGNPRVSVVVPVLNEEEFLEQMLITIRAQTFTDYELIVVDNGSNDRSPEIAARFADKVIPESCRGVDFALHRGILEARGILVAQADADTLYPPDWLSQMVRALASRGVVCAYGPWAYRENSECGRYLQLGLCRIAQLITHFLGVDLCVGFNMGFSREAYFQVGGYPALNHLAGVDVRLGLLLRRVGKVRFVSNMVAYTSNRDIRKRGFWRRWLLSAKVVADILLHRDRITLEQWYDWRRS